MRINYPVNYKIYHIPKTFYLTRADYSAPFERDKKKRRAGPTPTGPDLFASSLRAEGESVDPKETAGPAVTRSLLVIILLLLLKVGLFLQKRQIQRFRRSAK